MTQALKNFPNTEFKEPDGLLSYKTSKTSGLLSDSGIKNIMATKLTEKDSGGGIEKEIDTLCNGPVTENTPEESIKKIFIPNANPIIDRYDPKWLVAFRNALGNFTINGESLSEKPCSERPN